MAAKGGEANWLSEKVARLIRKSQPPSVFFFGYVAGAAALVGVQLAAQHRIGPLGAAALAATAWAIGTEHEATTWRRKLLKALSHQPPRAPDEPGDRAREAGKSLPEPNGDA